MEHWQNRVAVVTGASSGIGATVAQDLVKAGFIVVALARRKELIEEYCANLPVKLQMRINSYKCDVSSTESVNEAFDWISENFGGTDVLINCAGINIEGQIITLDINSLQSVMQTNVMGVIHCTRRAFESMKSRNFDGHIVLMNSILGHYSINFPGHLPVTNLYGPSKYALTAITEMLRVEFREFGTKIKITSISPGLVDTPFVIEAYKSLPKLAPDDISNAVLYALSTPPNVQVHDIIIKPVGEVI